MKDVVLLFFGVFLVVVLILYFLYRYKQYKFVKEKGLYYRDLMFLNSKYSLHEIQKKYDYSYMVKSKRAVDRFDFDESLLDCIENNYDNFRDNIVNMLENVRIINSYNNAYDEMLSKDYKYNESLIENSSIKSLSKFEKIEQKLLLKYKLKYSCELNVFVRVDYISPKGRSHWYKTAYYNYSQMIELYNFYLNRIEFKQSSKFQRSLMGVSLRYDVLKRDNYRCQICGASQKDGVKLEVDHIIPVSKGGKTTIDNLQTLCDACNRGKSNKM